MTNILNVAYFNIVQHHQTFVNKDWNREVLLHWHRKKEMFHKALCYSLARPSLFAENDCKTIFCKYKRPLWHISYIITHLAGQTYVWHGCKWNFAGQIYLQIYLQPAKIKSQHFGDLLKFWFVVKVFHMKTKCVSKFFISSVFTSDNQCPKYPSFWLRTYINVQLKQ